MRRIFINNLESGLERVEIDVANREFHHVKNVLRAGIGDKFELFNGKGLNAVGEISFISKSKLVFTITDYIYENIKENNINIAVAIVKPASFRLILGSLIQLGVNKIYPFVSEFSYIKNFHTEKTEKWNNILIDASKQSKNNKLTFIEKIYTIDEIMQLNCNMKIVFDVGTGVSIYDFSKQISNTDSLLTVIGPEGGFSRLESDKFSKNNFMAVQLKSNTLKTEIAAITSVSILKYLLKEL